jgi:hypothetical protein
MGVAGQASGAIAVAERGLAAHLQLTGPPLPFGPYLHQVIRSAALRYTGHLVEAAAVADLEYDKAVEEGSVEARSFLRACGAGMRWLKAVSPLRLGSPGKPLEPSAR